VRIIAAFIQGHNPATISQAYVHRMVLSSWPAMRLAQQRVSTAIMKRSGLKGQIAVSGYALRWQRAIVAPSD
jgi:hypothetical protein